jgi:hypothetical protein
MPRPGNATWAKQSWTASWYHGSVDLAVDWTMTTSRALFGHTMSSSNRQLVLRTANGLPVDIAHIVELTVLKLVRDFCREVLALCQMGENGDGFDARAVSSSSGLSIVLLDHASGQ